MESHQRAPYHVLQIILLHTVVCYFLLYASNRSELSLGPPHFSYTIDCMFGKAMGTTLDQKIGLYFWQKYNVMIG